MTTEKLILVVSEWPLYPSIQLVDKRLKGSCILHAMRTRGAEKGRVYSHLLGTEATPGILQLF